MRKTAIILLSFFLIFVTACSNSVETATEPDKPVSAQPAQEHTQGLLYNSEIPLNPLYTNDKINGRISHLIYNGLYSLDKSYKPQPELAESCTIADNKIFDITIRQGISFHSGAELTSSDVKYTIDTILNNSSSIYYDRLKEISSTETTGTYSLRITLNNTDALFLSMLDFPIVKSGAGKSDVNGTGRYKLQKGKLIYNDNYFNKSESKVLVKEIDLIANSDTDTSVSDFLNGKIGLLELSGDTKYEIKETGTRSAGSVVNNNLIYLGVNAGKRGLSNANVRRAISMAVNRVEDSESFVTVKPYVSYSCINPSWYLFDHSAISGSFDLKTSSSLLQAAGYNGNSQHIILNLSLLVNKENYDKVELAQHIAQNLLSVGIKITVDSRSWSDYTEALSSGDFDLYIGEVSIKNDMDVTSLIGSGGSLNYGRYSNNDINNGINAVKNSADDASLKTSASNIIKLMDQEMPIIPLYFGVNEFVTLPSSKLALSSSVSDAFSGIEFTEK
ncbi:MAG: ABC transporter substrate-binding protein [Bacillota bacterium]|nr:ABC transporter substrate-binding protein [Bacillota bacterium]